MKRQTDSLSNSHIVLDDRGVVHVHDEQLLMSISGAASAPAPGGGASSPGSCNSNCNNNEFCGNNLGCIGGGGNGLCRPIKE